MLKTTTARAVLVTCLIMVGGPAALAIFGAASWAEAVKAMIALPVLTAVVMLVGWWILSVE